MAKKQQGTDGVPMGHAELGAHQLSDGRVITTEEVAGWGFSAYCGNPAAGEPTVEAWNALNDAARKSWCDLALSKAEQTIKASGEQVDQDKGAAIVLTAQEQFGAALIDAALTEVKALEKPWFMLNADAQSEVLERITRQVRAAAEAAITTIATRGCSYIVCELESITVKKGAKAVLEIPKGGLDQDLLDAVGQPVFLVVNADMATAQDIPVPKPDPDQGQLPIGGTAMDPNGGDGDGGMVVHSDPQD